MKLTEQEMALALSPEHIGWNGLCGLIKQNWPQHLGMVDEAMAEADRLVEGAGGDSEVMSAFPAYYGTATGILRTLLTTALRRR